jgi:hypothetical protein
MNKFIRYVTISSSSKICFTVKVAKTFIAMDSRLVQPHKNFSSCNLLISEDVQSIHGSKEMVVLLCGMQTVLLRVQYVYTHRL